MMLQHISQSTLGMKLLPYSAAALTRYLPPSRALSVRAAHRAASTGRPVTSTATPAATASRLPVVALASILQAGLGSNTLQTLITQLFPPSRRNYSGRAFAGRMQLCDSIQLLRRRFLEALLEAAYATGLDAQQLLYQDDPRYMGNCTELLEHAQQKGGELSSRQVYNFIVDQGDAWIKQRLGLPGGLEEFRGYHIDHILPDAKGGRSHPCNYYVMPARLNQSFGAWISLDKVKYVGVAVTWAVLMYHDTYHPALANALRG